MKTVFITGASRGIGLATAKLFLSNGYRVFGTSTQGAIPIEHQDFTAFQLQLASHESLEKVIAILKQQNEIIDILINNAAICTDTDEEIPNIEKIRETYEVDVVGVIALTDSVLSMVPAGGQIINISSSCGSFSDPVDDEMALGYRMAKAAINMYTRSLALRLTRRKIVVSSIDPGWVSTDMGNGVATESEKPQQTPEGTAGDIFSLATNCVETGCFWRFGEKRSW